jgi:hypothetical protein
MANRPTPRNGGIFMTGSWQRVGRRWKLALFSFALSGLLIAGVAYSAAGPNAQLVPQDRAYGGGQFIAPDGIPRNFALDAHATSGGQPAYGDIEYGNSIHDQHEQVTCLNVAGNEATLGAIVTQADRANVVGEWVMMVVTDNGTPAFGSPDESSLQNFGPANDPSWPAGFPFVCPTPDAATTFSGFDFFPLTGGDIFIQHASS